MNAKTLARQSGVSLRAFYHHWKQYRRRFPHFPARGELEPPQADELLAYIEHRKHLA